MIPGRLNAVTLGARDLPRLRDFYEALGWEVAIEAEDFCERDGMRGFSLGINVDSPRQLDECIAAAEEAGAVVTKPPGDPIEFQGRNAYFADPEENYWEVVYLKSGPPGGAT